jgi:hypothetical protein
MVSQDVAHGDFVNVMPEIGQSALDTAIAPRGMLLRHANDELFNISNDAWSASLFPFLVAVELVGNQSFVPTHKGIGCGAGGSICELLTAERIGRGRQSAAFDIAQAQAAIWELGFKNPILFFEVGDHMLLMPLELAGDHGDQDLQNHGGSSGWRRRWGSMEPTTNMRKINIIESTDYFNITPEAWLICAPTPLIWEV